MFNVKRTLTAAALSTALAGGIFGLGATMTTTSASASAVSIGATAGHGPKCLWLQKNGHVYKGRVKNKLHVDFNRPHGDWKLKRERGCTRNIMNPKIYGRW